MVNICNELWSFKSIAFEKTIILLDLHILLNEDLEAKEARSVPHRDFYNIRKVFF